jgi:hypothetical protein
MKGREIRLQHEAKNGFDGKAGVKLTCFLGKKQSFQCLFL